MKTCAARTFAARTFSANTLHGTGTPLVIITRSLAFHQSDERSLVTVVSRTGGAILTGVTQSSIAILMGMSQSPQPVITGTVHVITIPPR
jgi:hypothetical protein